MTTTADPAQASHAEASAWMHRGLALLEEDSAARLEEAVAFFDRAIALRRELPRQENPDFGYGLAAGLINRGDALARLETPRHLAEALQSYEEAWAILAQLPWRQNSLYRRRLIIAWSNGGMAWQKTGRDGARKAISCFREALAVLEDSSAVAISDVPLLEAGVRTNLAAAWLELPDGSLKEIRHAAATALALVRLGEESTVPAAETGLKARHLLCRAIAQGEEQGEKLSPERIEQAVDAVDEGLALARRWEQRGERRFRALADELFRFGCRLYQIHRPEGLARFILQALADRDAFPLDPEWDAAATAALWQTLEKIQRDDFSTLETGPVLARVAELRLAEERLQELRRAAVPISA